MSLCIYTTLLSLLMFTYFFFFFFFNDTATTEIYTLSLHDALPISNAVDIRHFGFGPDPNAVVDDAAEVFREVAVKDRKSTRLNSSHSQISYAVFCLKKKKKKKEYIIVIDQLT